ncbi:MAG TPA: hypothetical protein PK514_09750 [Spirochaetota bacterium]|nr:hypothetical protein [Spirochaetota bacterium]
MKKLKMFSGHNSNDDIIKALKKQKPGDLLPEDGLFGFMYNQLNGPSIPFMISTAKETAFFYIDHEEFIIHVKDLDPEWVVEVDKNLVKLIMLYNIEDHQLLISFIFDVAAEMYQNAIKLLIKKKEFNLNYIAMLYGGLVLDSTVKYKIPDKAIKAFKNL